MSRTVKIRPEDLSTRWSRQAPLAVALVLGFWLASPGGVFAASLTTPVQAHFIPLTQTNWQPGLPPTVTNPLVFDKFDPALGQLLAVNVALNSSFNHDVTLRFLSPSTLTMRTQASSVSVRDPNGNLLISAVPPMVDESRVVSNGPFPQTVTIPTILQGAGAGPLALTDPATLAMFTASSPGETIALPVMASSSSAFSSSSGNGSGSIVTRASADVLISYTYVPEPSTLLILGLGFAGSWRFLSRKGLPA
ncbi:MAG: choice-of-anchor E domain-containing protein [Isosphaeraceae bacterium]